VAPAATVTEAGTVNTVGALLASVTVVMAAADLESVMVQVVLALDAKLASIHCRPEIVSGATRESVAVLEELLREAVTVAI